MAVTPAGGAKVSVSAAVPATFDAAGYLNIAWTPVGEVTAIPEFGREWSKVEHKPLAGRNTIKRKGGCDDGAIQLPFALDEKDPGQQLLEQARDDDANYYLRIDKPDGITHCAPIQVFAFKRQLGEQGQIIGGVAMIEITSERGNGWVRFEATVGLLDFTSGDRAALFLTLFL